ncbi:MAG TPA: T9SS type A sorting domain-containing protein [Bacteroidia bacterium]|nr:T9SS type A sorting domain-containing protein [Bacteroidia bacterium]HNU33105.1 T9SS type A sorting domain-containing protein [Bacteroidia bacterium]
MKKIFSTAIIVMLLMPSEMMLAQSILFANKVGGQQFDQAMGVAVDAIGNVITTGYFVGTSDFNSSIVDSFITSKGSHDVFVVKNDSAGNFLWAFGIGGTSDEFNYTSPVVDAIGNIYVCGVYSDTVDFDPSPNNEYKLASNGQYDGFIAKYTSNGGFVWAKSFGGLYNDDVYQLCGSANGDVLFAASYNDSADLEPDTSLITMYYSNGITDIFFGRITSAGNIIWLKTMGGIDYDHPNSISENYSGEIILQGGFTSSFDADPGTGVHILTGSNAPGFIAKYTQTGDYVWAHGFNSFSPFSSMSDAAGNIYSCGYINANVDLDPGPDTNKVFVVGSFDAYVAKYDINGNYKNAFGIGSNNLDVAYGIGFINTNQIVVGGYFYNSADFNPSPAVTNALASFGFGDVFVAQYDSALNYINAFKAGGAMFDFCRNIAVYNNQSLVIAGGFTDVADFDPSATLQTLSSTGGSRDGFIVQYGSIPTSLTNINVFQRNISVSPNPASDFILLNGLNNGADKTVTIMSVDGKPIKQIQLKFTTSHQINVSDLHSGLYLLKVQSPTDCRHVKFIKH